MNQIPLVNLKAQLATIRDEIDTAIKSILDNTQFIKGKVVADFEQQFADYCQIPYAVGTSSGTSALHLALIACGVKPGDEVITSTHTFIATGEAIVHAGAKPVFVDIDPVTYNIDPAAIEKAITDKTKAIIAVHLYGQMADMQPIADLCQKHDLKLIEDAAQAHGARYQGKPVGAYGDAACFSFYPGKNLGAFGDAGAVITASEEMAQYMRAMADHGRTDKYSHFAVGYNYRIDTLQAAILAVKLCHLPKWTELRQQVASYYRQHIANPAIQHPQEVYENHVYHLYVIRSKQREKLREYMAEQGVATGIHYPIPLHLQEAFAYLGYKQGDFPVAEQAAAEILSLPMFPELTAQQLEHICTAVNNFEQIPA